MNSELEYYKYSSIEKFTPFIAFCFAFNYVIGAPSLGFPLGFAKFGYLSSLITFAILLLLAYISCAFILDACSRTEALV